MTVTRRVSSIAELHPVSDGEDRPAAEAQPDDHEEDQATRRAQNPTVDGTTLGDQFRRATIRGVGIDEDSRQTSTGQRREDSRESDLQSKEQH